MKKKDNFDLKSEVIQILRPIFGDEVQKLLNEYYDSNNKEELINVARHMITGYMDEKIADRILMKLIKKFPELHIVLH